MELESVTYRIYSTLGNGKELWICKFLLNPEGGSDFSNVPKPDFRTLDLFLFLSDWVAWLVRRWSSAPKVAGSILAQVRFLDAENRQ
ncbi:hypothetical protein TNCV_3077801 [Trichonephila clavipes]|nr:hypothetical protein TNCV_3077801 [Trichonephila clavipes]